MRIWISIALVSILGLFLSLGGPSRAAQGPTAEELVHGVDQLLRADSNIMQFEMDVTTPDYQRTDVLKGYMEGQEKALVKLIAPEEERGTGWLKLGDQLWMFIPSVNQLMKIPPSMMMESFRGSTFSYDDLVKESSIVRDYTSKIVDTESREGMTVYLLELDPKPDAPVVYGKILLWVRQDFIPLKEEYYDVVAAGARPRLVRPRLGIYEPQPDHLPRAHPLQPACLRPLGAGRRAPRRDLARLAGDPP